MLVAHYSLECMSRVGATVPKAIWCPSVCLQDALKTITDQLASDFSKETESGSYLEIIVHNSLSIEPTLIVACGFGAV